MKELVSINGQITAPQDAKISVFDRGFLYGDSIYEVARSYGRIFFELEKHIDRLINSAHRLGFEIGMSKAQILDHIYQTYEKADRDNVYMRIIVSRGEGKLTLDTNYAGKPNIIVMIKDLELPSPDHYAKGIGAVMSTVQRNDKAALDPAIKSGNYLNNVLAYRETHKFGASEAIMLSHEGFITECTTSNFYVVENGVIHTAPLGYHILSGITRSVIVDICKKEGIEFRETLLKPERAFKAQECFLTGSVKEVMGITSINGERVGAGSVGPVTRRLAEVYKQRIKDYCEARKSKRYIV